MTVTTPTASANRGQFDSVRKAALVAGVLYLVTFITSIPAGLIQVSAFADPGYVASAGDDGLPLSAVLDVLTAIAGIGTAVAAFSVVKRQHEGLALGFVASRLFEAGILALGAVTVLSIVTLQQAAAASSDPSVFVPVGRGFIAMRDWSAVVGPGMASFNALMFATVLYRARLVPRLIPAMGLIGAPLFAVSVIAVMLGISEAGSAWRALAVAPIFAWELLIGLWMTFKGFDRSSPILAGAGTSIATPSMTPVTTATGTT